MTVTNRDLAELLARAADEQPSRSHRERALRRASVTALFWPEEAAAVMEADRPLTVLPAVGPWVGAMLEEWLVAPEPPEIPDPPPSRRGFLSVAQSRDVVRDAVGWPDRPRGDLQTHTTETDGSAPLAEMAAACAEAGYEFVAVTDHSKGLRVANGMDEERLAAQAVTVAAVNDDLARAGQELRVLHGLEMNLSPEGEGDMDPAALAGLDIVLATFHSKLRLADDQTDRYVAALRNPTFDVFAHPRCRMYGVRTGLPADWERVFAVAAEEGKAVEVDWHPHRQDLDVETLSIAREAGVTISMGSDAHSLVELGTAAIGMATLILAEIPPERVLNLMTRDGLRDWVERRRRG